MKNVTAINYRNVYESLQAIEKARASEHCPACSAPLDRVVVNPFDKARRELATLSVLEQLKTSKRRVEGGMTQLCAAIICEDVLFMVKD